MRGIVCVVCVVVVVKVLNSAFVIAVRSVTGLVEENRCHCAQHC